MEERKHRILVVSGRLLVAQGIVSLLEDNPQIAQVEVVKSLYDALVYCQYNRPDTLVIDLPSGADIFVDRPVTVDGHEIKTIVLLEEEETGQAHLYVHTPRRTANLQNLMSAILFDGENREETPYIRGGLATLMDSAPVSPLVSGSALLSQASNLIKARASGPRRSRISNSKTEL